ncbi:MAG: hypothetical protein NC930_04145, partial [Candidatus Omnitrophica bacterium]|nr:hypothetical protein [Candidatus Omnitrophota bacterium]
DPGTLKAAVQTVLSRSLDHLVLAPRFTIGRWIEILFTSYFLVAFLLYYRPWAAQNPRSRAYIGIGAFNLLRRDVYEAVGTHQKIAFEIVDDMELGKLVKRNSFRQMVMIGHEFISVRWVQGFRGVMNGLMKNAFAGLGYSLARLVLSTVITLAVNMMPFILVFSKEDLVAGVNRVSLVIIFLIYLAGIRYNSYSVVSFPMHAISSLLVVCIVWRSAVSILKSGGVTWRDTFYNLKALKKRHSPLC